MARNKHKNGIICTFPGCEKVMRTQKFKEHFIKNHLKDGEEYNVEHRKQYEVAREDSEVEAHATPPPDQVLQHLPIPQDALEREQIAASAVSTLSQPQAKKYPSKEEKQQQQQQPQLDMKTLHSNMMNAPSPMSMTASSNDILAVQAAAVTASTAAALEQQHQQQQQQHSQQQQQQYFAQASPSFPGKRALQDTVLDPSTGMNMLDFAVFLDKRFELLVNRINEMMATQQELIQVLRTNANAAAAASASIHPQPLQIPVTTNSIANDGGKKRKRSDENESADATQLV